MHTKRKGPHNMGTDRTDHRLRIMRATSMLLLAGAALPGAADTALDPTDMDFAQGLSGWSVSATNAQVSGLRTSESWNTYTLRFNSKNNSKVYFYICVSPEPRTGGTAWFDNIRAEGIDIENAGFERTLANGLPPGWDYYFGLYNEMKQHAKYNLGTDFQTASEGTLSLRFAAPAQQGLWKLRGLEEPEELAAGWDRRPGMEGWRPLYEAEIRVWQVLDVEPDTDYEIHMDYRISRDFAGTIRPAVGASMQPWHLLAHAGWLWSRFKEEQQLRDRFGRGVAALALDSGRVTLTRETEVVADTPIHVAFDVATGRKHNEKPLSMTATLVCEDPETGAVLDRDTFTWDGAPGHGESGSGTEVIEGLSTELRVNTIPRSNRLRVRLEASADGEPCTVYFGNGQIDTRPLLVPPVQELAGEPGTRPFRVGKRLTYTVEDGAAAQIEGALWLTGRDLAARGVRLEAARWRPDLRIRIGTVDEHGPEAYRLRVRRRGIDIEAAAPRAAQHALMTLLQLFGTDAGGPFFTPVRIADWPDMPVRGVVMESCSHFMPRGPDPIRLVDHLYHNRPRQTWCREDFLQLVRWKFNTVWWRSTSLSDRLLAECDRFHMDSMAFVSTMSDPPDHRIFVEHPEWIEALYVEDEPHTLTGTTPATLAHQHVLRTDRTDIVVRRGDGETVYENGRDYRIAGEFGTYNLEQKKMTGGTPFTIARLANSRIPDGAGVLVSYDWIGELGSSYSLHTQYCPSQPEMLAEVERAVTDTATRWPVKYLHIRGDELTHVNCDSRCRRRGLEPWQILLEHLEFIRDTAVGARPDLQVVMWHDSVCPFTYGAEWGFRQDGPVPPRDIWQFVWHYGPGQPQDIGWAGLRHAGRNGLTTVVLPWYNLRNIREWAQAVAAARKRGWDCRGILDTPWGHPNPFPNFRETATVSWRVPAKGERGWVPVDLAGE